MVGKVYRPKKKTQREPYRLTIMVGLSALIVGAISFRLFDLQIINAEYYSSLAEGQHKLYEELVPERGEILVRDNSGQLYPLAVNKELYLVYAVPSIVDDAEATSETIADILGISKKADKDEDEKKSSKSKEKEKDDEKEESSGYIIDSTAEEQSITLTYDRLKEKLSDPEDQYEILIRKLSKEKAEKLVDADLDGIRVQPEDWRYYPENSFAAHVLGYVGFRDEQLTGLYGVEGYHNDTLTGVPGYFEGERDTEGRWISIGQREISHAQDGADLVLSIDRTIQYGAERYAKVAFDKYKAQEVSIIVLDPMTGKIRALANHPTYNLNEYSDVDDVNVFNNSAIFDLYEPGSIFKPIVMAAAIDAGLVGPYSTFNNTGSVKVDSFTIGNVSQTHKGKTTMTEVLAESLNTGMVYVTDLLGSERLYDYLGSFGMNELTGIELESEGQTLLDDPAGWSKSKLATVGFGQGVASTALHIAMANAALANGGKLMQPQIIDEIHHDNGEVETVEPKEIRQVISAETSRTLSAMLVEGVNNGVAAPAAIPGYNIAGKTGTAQVAVNGSYDNSQKITSFVGYGPVPDPKFLMLVKIINPKNGKWGSTTAAPIFSQFGQEILQYYKVPPGEIDE